MKLHLGYNRNRLEAGQHDFNENKINLPKSVMIKFRDKFKIRLDEERTIGLSHHVKTRLQLVYIGVQ